MIGTQKYDRWRNKISSTLCTSPLHSWSHTLMAKQLQNLQITSSGFVFRAAAQIVVFSNSRQALLSVNCPKNELWVCSKELFPKIQYHLNWRSSVSFHFPVCFFPVDPCSSYCAEAGDLRAQGCWIRSSVTHLLCLEEGRTLLRFNLFQLLPFMPLLRCFFCTLDKAWLAAARKISHSIVLPLITESSR